jgi:ribonucleoside-diphosphate reductase alpha chain
MEQMFSFRGKLSSCLGEGSVRDYKAIYQHLASQQKAGKLPRHANYLGGNELAANIYEKKYYLKDLAGGLIEKSPEDVFTRVSAFVAATENDRPTMFSCAEEFYNELYTGRFIPGGRVLAGAGDMYRLKTLANCFVSRIDEDSIDSLYATAYQCARTYSFGGGIGVDITPLRPKDSIVHNAADCSTGAVSFMELFSMTTGLIGQSGRRGALMLTVDVKHPDITEFIRVKKDPNWVTQQIVKQCSWSGKFEKEQLQEIEKQVAENTQIRFANISIKVSDEFLTAVEEQKKYGPDKLLVYRKRGLERVNVAHQSTESHYSVEIPSKDISDYTLLKEFDTLEELNIWLQEETGTSLSKEELNDPAGRDVFGDILRTATNIKMTDLLDQEDLDYEYAIRSSGDYLLYYASKVTGEIRELIKARKVWDLFIEGNYRTAEPGLIFWKTMSRYSPSNYVGRPIISTNPCAEVPLEDGGACNLGSINLARFVKDPYSEKAVIDWEQLKKSSAILVRFLDNVVSWNERLNPLGKQRQAASETRRLGLGVMGIADMLFQLQLDYDSEDGISIVTEVMKCITNSAYSTSADLAEIKGASPIFNQKAYFRCPFVEEALDRDTIDNIEAKGLRNIAIMSIAPTGTISNIVLGSTHAGKNYIGVSGGIEPVFAQFYTRRSESLGNKFFKVFHSSIEAWLEMNGLSEKADTVEKIEDLLPSFFSRTAHQIDPEKRVEIQGRIQRYIDHSISSTINLPEDVNPELIGDVYLNAWRSGLKGVTVYRDGSRMPILSVDGSKTEFQEFKEKRFRAADANGVEREFAGDELIHMPDGSLTTAYHYFKFSSISMEKMLDGSAFQEVGA